MEFDIKKHTIYRVIHGSRAYGTNTLESDTDYKGIAIAPMEYYLGFLRKFEQSEKYENKGAEYDEVIYDIQKFMKLATDANPSVLETLFVDDEFITDITKEGLKLRGNRDLFLSAKAKFTYCGYAFSQMKRASSRRQWILNPPKKPNRSEYNLPEDRKPINSTDMGAFEKLSEEGYDFDEKIMNLLQKERAYQTAMIQWKQYNDWLSNRNPERFKTEKKAGYDCKNAQHLIRLARTGKELLEGKGIKVKRNDYKDLLDIRNGLYTYEEIIDEAKKLFEECDKLYEKIKNQIPEKRSVPLQPPRKKINELCISIIEEFHNKNFISPKTINYF